MANDLLLNDGTGTKYARTLEKTSTKHTGVHVLDLGGAGAEMLATGFPAGFLKVTDEPHQLFLDTFDTILDTNNRWNFPVTGNSAVAAAVTAGVLSLATGTVASGYSYLVTVPSFGTSTPGYIRYAMNVALPDGAAPTANSFRYWGSGTANGVPAVATPILNGCGFEVATTGKLWAVVYSGGSRAAVADLSASGSGVQPLDALYHNYQVFQRPTGTYFYLDNVLVATASLTQSALAVDTVPLIFMALGGGTPPSPSAVLTSNGCSVSDTAKNNSQISDGVFPWRKAQVGKSLGLAVRGASIAGSTLQVTAATPVTGPGTDASEAGNVTFIVKNTVAGTAFTGAPLIVFEQSDDNVSWAPLPVQGPTGLISATQLLSAGAANAEVMFDAALEGVNWVRVRVVTAQAANGMTVVTQMGGMAFSPTVGVSGAVAALDGAKATYTASIVGMSTIVTGDIFTLIGSASKTIRVVRVEVSCTVGAATNSRLALYKKSALDTTGGTPAAATVAPNDTANPAATATASGYTVVLTAPAAIVAIPGTVAWYTAGIATISYRWDFGTGPRQGIVLRGTSQSLSLFNTSGIGTSGVWNIVFEFTEE